ncbi:eukaryotic translation initiation factor 2-alpha kinase 1-like [Macrosteles quadrilineatus]|uniref:eukaryotic translation initiation factor 2-alpha kinase 1-like n=1 Tax=Macrosteles quadrilineatus TaxID=74068 RepID=UPI0023E2105E|nr:eukaryotic translation initiation factor 2-alpha kinase 1-like [Macrosteles quadrilineatus]XP_054282121.1 eukaryotic translation initiation factor 2-alpha kinase 1-like [Macrosteles quadrilineatus]
MRDEDSDWWSGLQTVSSFDNGVPSPTTLDAGDGIQQFNPSSLLVESLIGQLCKLAEKNPRHQKQLYLKICKKLHQMKLIDETYEMDEFESMRSYYQKALYQMVCAAKCANKTMDKKAVISKPNQQVCLKSKSDAIHLEWSRYSTEYEEMDFIARGGFGQVFRARHKLDCELYAVKKIYLRYNNAAAFLKSLAEVKMLARLNHPNIVAYKAAWLEPIDPAQRKKHFFHDVSSCIVDPSTEIQDSSDSIVFESSDRKDEIQDSEDNLAIVKPADTLTDWQHSSLSNNYSQEWACLYIQMQLCEVTLRQWLDNRNQKMEPVNEHQCLTLFKKIVQGVEYIHSQGIVHHDIKPSNIFVSSDLSQLQVGDFGLACSLLTHNQGEVAVIPSTHAHRGQVGTKLYAAPEQLSSPKCTPKSDIYSLGVVLLELIQPFQTDMERSKVISKLKAGHIPPELSESFPILVGVIRLCVFGPPKNRPSANQLLKMLEEKDSLNSARIIAEKDEMIQRLHQEAFEREREITELKRQLSELTTGTPPGSLESTSKESFTSSSQFL